jgi:quercetin dioxygenase-like cupin family protein
MESINRRQVIVSLAALGLMSQMAEAQAADASVFTESKLFKFDAVRETFNAQGGGSRPTLARTVLPSGEVVGVHVGTIPPRKTYSPMHANANAEILIVFHGKMDFLTEVAPPKSASAGDVIYAAANEKHSLRNPGDDLATYFVVAIGGPKPAALKA